MAAEPFLDSWRAKAVAGLVLICCCAGLAYLHRADIVGLLGDPARAALPAATGPLADCLARRYGSVDKMLSDNIIDEKTHTLFRQRAEAMCRDKFGK